MIAQIQDREAQLTAILEHCHTAALNSGTPDSKALPQGFSDTPGYFPVYFPDEIAHAAGLLPASMILYVPQHPNAPEAIRHIVSGYQQLQAELASKVGHPISDAAIRASIQLYNKKRRLMRDLYEIRRDEPWKLSCTESSILLRAGTSIICEEHIELLEQALDAIRHRQVVAQDKPRVIFVGGFCEQPPLGMLEAIDDVCFVADDDLLAGQRWFTADVPEEVGDPVLALAESYIEHSKKRPMPHDERKPTGDYLMAMLRAAKADAAILTAAKFCEPGLDDQLGWSKDLDEEGVQYLVLEIKQKMNSFEKMSMQLENFAESLLFAIA